jgi:hypothetical protein
MSKTIVDPSAERAAEAIRSADFLTTAGLDRRRAS